MNRPLYRCRENRRIAGVAGGVAEFFGLDPTLVRVLWFLSIFFGGFGIVAYAVLAIALPLEPVSAEAVAAAETMPLATGHRHAYGSAAGVSGGRLMTIFGATLIVLGGLALAGTVLPIGAWRFVWPALFIGLGALLLVGALRRGPTQT